MSSLENINPSSLLRKNLCHVQLKEYLTLTSHILFFVVQYFSHTFDLGVSNCWSCFDCDVHKDSFL